MPTEKLSNRGRRRRSFTGTAAGIATRRIIPLFSLSLAVSLNPPSFASNTRSEDTNLSHFTINDSTLADPGLQEQLKKIDREIREQYGMTSEHAAAGLLDLDSPRLAMINPDRMEYAASVPKIGILLAFFELHPAAASSLDPDTRRALGLMIKVSSNEMATRFSREIGLKKVQGVLDEYGFYDESRGGGIWVGKHYGAGDERYGDPVHDHSHGATVRQLLRFYLLLEQGELVSREASKSMLEIFASPDIPHDDIKFVKGLAGRDVSLLRKWGTWRDWRHDTAMIQGPQRHYVLVGLTRHPRGDDYLADLAAAVDRLMEAGQLGQEDD